MPKLTTILENVLFWAGVILVLFIPLFMKFPLIKIGGSFVSVRTEDVLILLTYLVWAGYLVLSGDIKSFLKDKLNQAFFVFFLIGAISAFSGAFLTHTISVNLGVLHLARRIEIVLFLPFFASIVKTKRRAYVLLGTFSIVIFIACFYALGQRYLGFPAVSTTNAELAQGVIYYIQPFGRIISTFAGHYDLAIFLVMGLTIISSVIFYFMQKKNIFYIGWLGFLGVLSGLVLVMTAARLSFVAAFVGIVLALILAGKKKFILVLFVLAALALAYPSQLRERFVSTFTVNILRSWEMYFNSGSRGTTLNIPTLPKDRIRDPKEATDETALTSPDIVPGEPVDITDLGVYRSFEIRIRAEWPRAIRAFVKNPFLGTGYSSVGLAVDNDILRSLGEVGILGTFAFFLVIYETVKRIIVIYRSQSGFVKYLSGGVLAMTFAFIVNSLFIDVFEASKTGSIFWMILGITLALGKISGKNDKAI
jgi:hypothetical protein